MCITRETNYKSSLQYHVRPPPQRRQSVAQGVQSALTLNTVYLCSLCDSYSYLLI